MKPLLMVGGFLMVALLITAGCAEKRREFERADRARLGVPVDAVDVRLWGQDDGAILPIGWAERGAHYRLPGGQNPDKRLLEHAQALRISGFKRSRYLYGQRGDWFFKVSYDPETQVYSVID